jgi:hypothetical protein
MTEDEIKSLNWEGFEKYAIIEKTTHKIVWSSTEIPEPFDKKGILDYFKSKVFMKNPEDLEFIERPSLNVEDRINILNTAKNKAVKEGKYELASRLRDLERELLEDQTKTKPL